MSTIMEKCSIVLLIFFLIFNYGFPITLDGKWMGTIKYCGKSINNDCKNDVTFPVVVPGGIYTDLMSLNLIPNNFVGKNDINNRWVGNQSVTYTKNFDVDDDFLKVRKVALIFHGLDTFATILLNDHKIGESSNMFLRYTFDVTQYIKHGKNVLEVSFSSPVKAAEELYKKQSEKYIVPPVCVPETYNGQCHVNHIRKLQASFSWDWGPAFPSMGIWKSVELIPVNEVLITEVTTDIHKKDNVWNIIITTYLQPTSVEDYKYMPCNILSVLHLDGDSNIENSTSILLNANNKYTGIATFLEVSTDRVHRWWPNGYGDQNLYKLTVSITTPNSETQKEVRIGFRTVELVEESLEKGLSFYFRVNDVPMFAKGSNFIPASVFPELGAKEDTIRNLLSSTKETHMNMLRVWGGGVYESDLFYNLADEYGIMIWQDFMFACAMYPTTQDFLESVKEEVVQNVRRLKNHPSIVLWAGNNENEAALYGNWYGTGSEKVYREDYVKLYVDVIKKEVEELDSTRPFVVSSPGNGKYAKDYDYVGKDPYSSFYGDVHYYNYIGNGWDSHQYPRPRFSSEYGFQSLPSIFTITSAIETLADLNIDSSFMKNRQHLPSGTSFMKNLISTHFTIPETNNTIRDFIDFIYLSQVHQAVAVKVQTESYRQAMSDINEVGEGMTMGALYWQLNDVWQAPSWSSIDFDGRWKMLHYYAADFFAPIIVTYKTKGNYVSAYIVSEKLYPILNATLEINLYSLHEMRPVYSHICENIFIGANKVTKVDACLEYLWMLKNTSCYNCESADNDYITTFTLKDKDGNQIAPTNYKYPSKTLKNFNLPVVDISIKINDYHLPGKYSNYPDIEIDISTNNVALFVWLETANIPGRFSENGFHMFTNTKRIIFHSYEMITPRALKEKILITTLSDIYNPNRKDNVNIILNN